LAVLAVYPGDESPAAVVWPDQASRPRPYQPMVTLKPRDIAKDSTEFFAIGRNMSRGIAWLIGGMAFWSRFAGWPAGAFWSYETRALAQGRGRK